MTGECVGGPLDGKSITDDGESFSVGINFVRGGAVVGSVEHVYMREGRSWLACFEISPRREPFAIVPAIQEQVEAMSCSRPNALSTNLRSCDKQTL